MEPCISCPTCSFIDADRLIEWITAVRAVFNPGLIAPPKLPSWTHGASGAVFHVKTIGVWPFLVAVRLGVRTSVFVDGCHRQAGNEQLQMPPSPFCCIGWCRPSQLFEITEQRHAAARWVPEGELNPAGTPLARRGGHERADVVVVAIRRTGGDQFTNTPGGRPRDRAWMWVMLPTYLQLVRCSQESLSNSVQTQGWWGVGRAWLWPSSTGHGLASGIQASQPSHRAGLGASTANGWSSGTPPAVVLLQRSVEAGGEHGRQASEITLDGKQILRALVWSEFWCESGSASHTRCP